MFDLKQIAVYLKNQFSKKDLFFLFLLFLLFFLTRLINLDNFPIFSDEGIYIRWAKVAWKDASWRFISLTDGRQPLQTWGTIVFLKFFPDDALFAGRLFSVATGFVSLVGIFSLLTYLFKKQTAYLGSLLYIFTPFFLFYDRMALVDSAVNAGFIWIFFLSIVLVQTRRLDVALIMGFVGGFSLLTKSSSRMFLALAALAPILTVPKKIRNFILNTVNYFVLLGIVIFISLLMYNIQRLSPYLHFVEQKNATFVMTFSEFVASPWRFFWGNIFLIPKYVIWELGGLIILFALFGLWQLWLHQRRLFLYFLSFIIIPIFAIAFFAKVIFPRYLIFLATMMLLSASYSFAFFKNTYRRNLIFGALILTLLVLDYPLIFDAKKAFFPPVDRGQYVEGLTAVWGADEMMDYIKTQSKTGPVLVLAEGDFGLVGDVLRVFVDQDDKVEIKGLWPFDEAAVLSYQAEKERKVYLVFSHTQTFPENWPIQLIKSYSKPNSQEKLFLFEYKNLPINLLK